MRVDLYIDQTADGFVWSADSEDVPELTAVAEQLHDLIQLVREAASMEGWSDPEFCLARESGEVPASGEESAADHWHQIKSERRLIDA